MRYKELDALRGLAAATVVALHIIQTYTWAWSPTVAFELLERTPLVLVDAGHEAVIFFFILSGFVLALPYMKDTGPTYITFILRRICRIYLPFAVSLLFTLLVIRLVWHPGLRGGDSQWFVQMWRWPTPWHTIWTTLGLLDVYDTTKLNTVYWSLTFEMRISLLFPFIIWLVRRFRVQSIVMLCVVLSLLTAALAFRFGASEVTSYLFTMHYAVFFITGALLAKYREPIQRFMEQRNKWWVLLVALALYTGAEWILGPLHIKHMEGEIGDWMTGAGAVLILLLALSWERMKGWLNVRPVAYLGKVSYSLYLVHAPIVFGSIYALQGIVGHTNAILISLPLVLVITELMYRYVEVPAIRLGRSIRSVGKGQESNRPNVVLR